MDKRMDGKSPHSTGLCPLLGPLPKREDKTSMKKKIGETRRKMKNKWRDKMQDKKNGVTRQRQKRWGDEMQDKKKWGDKTRDKNKWGDKTQDKKMGG